MGIRGIVDRIEGAIVVIEVEGGEMKDFSIKQFPSAIQPGDAVLQMGNTFVVDQNKTEQLKKEIKDLMDELFIDE